MSERILKVVLQYQGVSSAVSPMVPPLCYGTRSYVDNTDWVFGTDPYFVEGRLIQPGLIERTMYGAGRLRGATPAADGAIVLNNADGELDDILSYSFDGQPFILYEVDPDTLEVLYQLRQGFLEQPTYDGQNITFQARDSAHALDINLLDVKYAGTNALPAGIEGTADDIGGTPKPALVGTCYNVTPKQVNTSKKIYQIDGVRGLRSGYTLALYDKRSAVTQDGAGDYASQADMENNANIPAVGQYRVWPAGGCIRINFTPAGALTCDVTNPADHGGSGVAEVDHVLKTLHQAVLGSRGPESSSGFALTGQLYDNKPDVGIYIDDSRTALQAYNEVLASVGGYILTGDPLDGAYTSIQLNAAQLYEPSAPFFTPQLSPILITENEIVEGTYPALVPPAEADRGLPVWRVNVQYAKNWTVMTENDLAGIAAAEVARWTREYLTASAEDATIKDDWPQALELTVTTLIVDQADAEAEAQRLLDLFGVPRQRFTLSVPAKVILEDAQMGTSGRQPYQFQPGARITLQIPRFGLDAGKTFVVTEMREDYEAEIFNLVIWG